MKNYFKGTDLSAGVRQHPWTTALSDESRKYYDFKAQPEVIPKVLEDFKPFADYDGVQKFYELLRFINGRDSEFESNDCAFIGPHGNDQREKFPKELKCSGRLMVLFRDLRLNLSEDSVKWFAKIDVGQNDIIFTPGRYVTWLAGTSLEIINQLEPGWHCVAVEYVPAFFIEAPVFHREKAGYQVTFHFWAWGDDANETMANFGSVVNEIRQTLELLSSHIKENRVVS